MITIRPEQPEDLAAVREVNRRAFGQEEEGRIVDALRANGAVMLSLVAVEAGAVVGHILFTPLSVGPAGGAALGPMAVEPERQRQGVGSRLVLAGVEELRELGCPFIVLIGHPDFYPRFGFEPGARYGLTCEWDLPAEVLMVKLLDPNAAGLLRGVARYRAEFSAGG